MKIAYFHYLNFGGAKRAAFEQAKFLIAQGHTVDFYTINNQSDIFDLAKIVHQTYNYSLQKFLFTFPFFTRFIQDFQTFFILPTLHKKIAQDIDSRKYDIVIVHPDKATQAPFLLQYVKTPTVYYCQEPLRIVYEYSLRNKESLGIIKRTYEELTRLYRKYIDRKNVRSATFPVASCYHIRERMIEAYDVLPHVCYLGIDTNIFVHHKKKIKNEVFFVGGKDVPTDGYDLAIKALEKIPQKDRPQLRVISWVKNNQERLTEKELVEIYNASLATLCLSTLETFGLVPLESMACGTPVIATNVSGHRETVINNQTGFLVDFDPEEIAQKILFLKNMAKREKIGQQAVKHVRAEWTWEKRGKEFELFLKKCLHTLS